MTTSELVLGSSSRYRAELLKRLGVPFTQASPSVDERSFDERFEELGPEEFSLMLARAKVEALRQAGGSRWILCADQVGYVTLEDGRPRQLSKPGDEETCVEQLMMLAGRSHVLVNGIVLRSEATGEELASTDIQTLTMRRFDRAEAAAYVSSCRPLDCAGGYRIEDAGIRLFESMKSDDYTGIIGLPLLRTAELLRQAGLLVP